jgi:Tfp pilus assembly protein FimT
MRARNNNAHKQTTAAGAGFTLVELILVMAVMVTILAFIAPMLRNSFKQRGINQEAVRLLALTEYARNEAVSQGVPTQVWIDPAKGNFGAEAMPGYDGDKESAGPGTAQGATDTAVRVKEYALPADTHFDTLKSTQRTAEGYVQVIEFNPDGTPTTETGIDSIRIVDKDNNSALLTLTTDGWGYEITKEDPHASRR